MHHFFMPAQYFGNFDRKLINSATQVIICNIEVLNSNISIQSIYDISGALVGYIATLNVQGQKCPLIYKDLTNQFTTWSWNSGVTQV